MMQKSNPPTDTATDSVGTIGALSRRSATSANASKGATNGKPNARTSAKRGQADTAENQSARIADILDSEYRGISLYTVTMILLVIAILWTGINVVEQIQTYHKSYNDLAKLKREFRQLQIEHQRMMIEQQTFSGTPQVTSRAATQLNMFYPDFADRMIIHANGVVVKPPGNMTARSSVADEIATTPSNTPIGDTPSNTEPSQPAPETQH